MEAPVCLEEDEFTKSQEDYETCRGFADKIIKLNSLSSTINNIDKDDMHVEFSNMNQICKDGFFLIDGGIGFHVDNKPEQIKYSVTELKAIADNLGITYSKNATKKVMSKLVLEFVQKVVAILNS